MPGGLPTLHRSNINGSLCACTLPWSSQAAWSRLQPALEQLFGSGSAHYGTPSIGLLSNRRRCHLRLVGESTAAHAHVRRMNVLDVAEIKAACLVVLTSQGAVLAGTKRSASRRSVTNDMASMCCMHVSEPALLSRAAAHLYLQPAVAVCRSGMLGYIINGIEGRLGRDEVKLPSAAAAVAAAARAA